VTSTEATVGRSPTRDRPQIPRWDQQLRAAKNEGRSVKFQLALEAFFTDEDAIVRGMILETDKAGIKIVIDGTDIEVWIGKDFIVGTEVLDAT
jgi:hypothetical protein